MAKTVSVSDDVYAKLVVYTAKLMKERLTKVSLSSAVAHLLTLQEK